MAGFRDFQTGEVLTAANVNDFLAKQAVMKFADATARDTALGTAVGGSNALREGMVAYLDSTDEVQYYGGTAWAALGSDPNPGIGTNVVQTVKTDTFSTSSTSFTDITGLAVTITPTSATAKVLLIAQVAWGATAAVSAGFGLQITGGNAGTYIGDAGTGQTRAIFKSYAQSTYEFDRSLESMVAVYLDSPATTSATTYQLQTYTGAGTAYVNRSGDDLASSSFGRGASSITAIEVAA